MHICTVQVNTKVRLRAQVSPANLSVGDLRVNPERVYCNARTPMCRVALMSLNVTPGALVPQWTLGDRLRKARVAAGLSQVELGEQISVSRRQIIDYENDKKTPSRGHLLLWQMMTRVPAVWLVTGTEPEPGTDPDGGGVTGRYRKRHGSNPHPDGRNHDRRTLSPTAQRRAA